MLQVDPQRGTSGSYSLQAFLVGDANSDFRVDTQDLRLIRSLRGTLARSDRYQEAADTDRNGVINGYDWHLANANRGAATRVRPLSLTVGLDPSADDGNVVDRPDVAIVGTTLPNATVRLDQQGDGSFEQSTTADASGAYRFEVQVNVGANPFQVEAAETFGQRRTASLVVNRIDVPTDTTPPTILTGPNGLLTLAPTELTLLFSEAMSVSAFQSSRYTLTGPGGLVGPITITPISDSAVRLNLPTPLVNGDFTLSVDAGLTDLAGNPLADARSFAFRVEAATRVASLSPANGEQLVSLTRETVLRFDKPIDPGTLDAEAFHMIALGQRVSGRIVVSPNEQMAVFFYDEPLTPSTEVRVVVDGDRIMGRDGLPVDADRDGLPGGVATADFTTLPLTFIPRTTVWGYVYDSYNRNPDGSNIPVVGAKISLDADPSVFAVTDATGYFELGLQDENNDGVPDGLPAPEFFVHIDGGAAINAPEGTAYATLGKPFHSVPGQRVQLEMDGAPFHVYLPPMAMSDIVPLDPDADTVVGFGPAGLAQLQALFPDLDPAVFARMQVTYPAGSAQDASGNPATVATIIPVAPDRLPAPLPPNVTPQLVISIQAGNDAGFNLAGGPSNFLTPAPATFPNLEGLAPGEKSLIFSFDHDAGRWVVIGTGTVSEDGLTLVSDPGVGILAPGWHFVQVGTVTDGEPCVENQVCVQVNGGMLGDVIKVDLSGTGGRDFQLHSNSVAGRIAEIDNWEEVLRDTGIFYFLPNIPDNETRFTQAPVTAEYTFSGIGRLATDPPDAPERRLTFTVQIKDITPGYTSSGDAAVPAGALNSTNRLAVYRVQQRLRYLGYKSQTGNAAQTVTVDGALGNGTRHALGVLNAAVSGVINENHAASNEVSAWINAANAPRWVEYHIPAAGVIDNELNHEHWMTSWTRDSLQAFDAANALVFGYNGASQRGGGDTPHHGTHEAGMDLDIDITVDEQNSAETNRNVVVGPMTALEQSIVDRMLSVYNARTVPIGRILVGFPRIVDAFNTSTGTTIAALDDGNVHDNHFHIDYQPPAMDAGASLHALVSFSIEPQFAALSTATGFGTDARLYYRFELANGVVLSNGCNLFFW